MWTWSGEGTIASHGLPLRWMKFAVSSIDAALTTSHILNDVKEAAKINQYHGSKKTQERDLGVRSHGPLLEQRPAIIGHNLE